MLASARSMPSPSVATVGPRPAEPTSALSTRSQSVSVISSTRPSAPAQHLAGRMLGRPRGRVRVGQRDPLDPEARAPARAASSQLEAAARPDHLELVGALDHVERLRSDRAGRPDDEDPAHPAECRRPPRLLPAGDSTRDRDQGLHDTWIELASGHPAQLLDGLLVGAARFGRGGRSSWRRRCRRRTRCGRRAGSPRRPARPDSRSHPKHS